MNICLPYLAKFRPVCSVILAAALAFTASVHAGSTGSPGALLVAAQSESAAEIPVNPGHPDEYVVQLGDTLWDIAGVFLQDPWYWPEIWHVNPQVPNPHLIYPGDILTMAYVEGRPQIRLQRGAAADQTIERGTGDERLAPQIRVEDLDAIPAIPAQDIGVFFARGTILEKEQAEGLPYIVAMHEHLVAGAGHEVFVRGMDGNIGERYSVVRKGDPLVDPEDRSVVGYEGIYLGEGTLQQGGDPATIFLNDTTREVRQGDFILPLTTDVPLNFFPSAPEQKINGQIIAVVDGVSRIGQYQTVILNRGGRDRLQAGDVLKAWKSGETVTDRFANGYRNKKVTLPMEMVGTLMVIKAYDRISYALVMEATSEIRVLDTIKSPE